MTEASPEFLQLQVTRALKKKMPRIDGAGNESPFADRVITTYDQVAEYDIPELQGSIRMRIEHVIETVGRGESKSQVILLAGEVGAGKSHLIRSLYSPGLMPRLGHIPVGGSNHWDIQDFNLRLLDWLIEALTSPSPSKPNLLEAQIQAIAFRALDHLLANPVAWRKCLIRPKGWFRSWRAWLRTPSREQLLNLTKNRDPAIFAALDLARFSDEVCDRFLANPSNINHRHALRVLLTGLFPDHDAVGTNSRERVLQWLRGRADDGYFNRRLGVKDSLDRKYAQFDAVRLLIHLFSPSVAKELATEAFPCRPKLFLFVFDQVEGRNELFNSESDWSRFFAEISELYNTLPNVVILFPMTLGLRTRLLGLMERQFKDRIRMDDRYILINPDESQILELYRKRIEHSLRNDQRLLEDYKKIANPYTPFSREQVLSLAGAQTARVILGTLDCEYHRTMSQLAVEPELDFHFQLNEMRVQETTEGDFDYTADHLKTVRDLLLHIGSWITDEYGIHLQSDRITEVSKTSPQHLGIEMWDPNNPKLWSIAYIARLPYQFNAQVIPATRLLSNKNRSRYFLFMIRAREFDPEITDKQDQIFCHVTPASLESRLRALLHLISKQQDYQKEGQWDTARKLILREVGACYLGELFKEARKRLDRLQAAISAGTIDPTDDVSTPPDFVETHLS